MLSRALEYEIKISFYKNYLEYLKVKFQINDYIEANNLSKLGEYKSRKLIVDMYEDEEGKAVVTGYHEYEGIGEKQFTLGSINYPIGFSYKSNISTIDITFIDYCKRDLWGKESTEEDIITWITSICKISPDTIGIDYFFLLGFLTQQMEDDFSVIEHEFLARCRTKLDEFNASG